MWALARNETLLLLADLKESITFRGLRYCTKIQGRSKHPEISRFGAQSLTWWKLSPWVRTFSIKIIRQLATNITSQKTTNSETPWNPCTVVAYKCIQKVTKLTQFNFITSARSQIKLKSEATKTFPSKSWNLSLTSEWQKTIFKSKFSNKLLRTKTTPNWLKYLKRERILRSRKLSKRTFQKWESIIRWALSKIIE